MLSTTKIKQIQGCIKYFNTKRQYILKDSDFAFSSKIYILTFISGDSLGEHEIPRKPAFTKMLSWLTRSRCPRYTCAHCKSFSDGLHIWITVDRISENLRILGIIAPKLLETLGEIYTRYLLLISPKRSLCLIDRNY